MALKRTVKRARRTVKRTGYRQFKRSVASDGVGYPIIGRRSLFAGPGTGLGESLVTVLKSCIFANVTTDNTGVYKGTLMPGSVYQPFGSVSSVQPQLYDQYSQLFGRYVVLKAYVRIEPSVLVGTDPKNVSVFAAYPTNQNGISLANFQAYASQPYSVNSFIGTWDTTKENTLHFNLSTYKVLGKRDKVTAEDNGAQMGSNPPNYQSMNLPFIWQYKGAEVANGTMMITMYQTVQFDRRLSVTDA